MFKVYVGNLDPRTTLETLKPYFDPFGEAVDEIILALDAEGQPRGEVMPQQLSKRQQKKLWAASRAAELGAESPERTDGGGGGSKQHAPKEGAAGRKRDRGCADCE